MRVSNVPRDQFDALVVAAFSLPGEGGTSILWDACADLPDVVPQRVP